MEPGPNPPDLYDVQVGLKTDPKPDSVPGGTAFGDVVTQPEAAYVAGETVTARFRAGNPWLASKVCTQQSRILYKRLRDCHILAPPGN